MKLLEYPDKKDLSPTYVDLNGIPHTYEYWFSEDLNEFVQYYKKHGKPEDEKFINFEGFKTFYSITKPWYRYGADLPEEHYRYYKFT